MENNGTIEAQIKAIKDEILAGVGDSGQKMQAMQRQLDALDSKLTEKHYGDIQGKTIEQHLKESDNAARLVRDGKGMASFSIPTSFLERKAILSANAGFVTPGVIAADRNSGIVAEARRQLMVRNVLTARPTALPLVYWVKVDTPYAASSFMMQAEGLVKHEGNLTFTTVNSTVRTIATFMKASKQILDDFTELGGFLQSTLPFYVNKQEDSQLLSGDGTGNYLYGMIPQATAFNTALLPPASAYTRLDQIAAGIAQLGIADEVDPSFVILNKQDWWAIRRLKDSLGRYILGDPQSSGTVDLWGLTPVATNAIAQGTFLVGSGDPAAIEIRDRMEMEVTLSTEDSDNYERNLVSIRAEKRMCLTVKRGGAFVTGTFSTSPA